MSQSCRCCTCLNHRHHQNLLSNSIAASNIVLNILIITIYILSIISNLIQIFDLILLFYRLFVVIIIAYEFLRRHSTRHCHFESVLLRYFLIKGDFFVIPIRNIIPKIFNFVWYNGRISCGKCGRSLVIGDQLGWWTATVSFVIAFSVHAYCCSHVLLVLLAHFGVTGAWF